METGGIKKPESILLSMDCLPAFKGQGWGKFLNRTNSDSPNSNFEEVDAFLEFVLFKNGLQPRGNFATVRASCPLLHERFCFVCEYACFDCVPFSCSSSFCVLTKAICAFRDRISLHASCWYQARTQGVPRGFSATRAICAFRHRISLHASCCYL